MWTCVNEESSSRVSGGFVNSEGGVNWSGSMGFLQSFEIPLVVLVFAPESVDIVPEACGRWELEERQVCLSTADQRRVPGLSGCLCSSP